MIITETFERAQSIPKQAFLCRAGQVLCWRWLRGSSRSGRERSHITPQVCFGMFSTSSVVQGMSTRGEWGAPWHSQQCWVCPDSLFCPSFYLCFILLLLDQNFIEFSICDFLCAGSGLFVPVCVVVPPATLHPSEVVVEQLACAWPVGLAGSWSLAVPVCRS